MSKSGRGNPPPHSRFKKGVSGNPKGRPKRRKDQLVGEIVSEVQNTPTAYHEGGRTKWASRLVLALKKLVNSALKGDARSAEELFMLRAKASKSSDARSHKFIVEDWIPDFEGQTRRLRAGDGVHFTRAGARKLAARGRLVVILPALAYTAASFGAAFHGTLSISAITVTALIVDVARNLSDQGFRLLALANVHLDPEHLTALNEAVNLAKADRLLPIIFPDLTRKPWGTRLGDEFKSGACHAGQFESSIVIAERPDGVRETIRASLVANPISLSQAIKAGKRTFDSAGGPRAYFGDPAAATADEGARLIDALGAILEEAVNAEI